MKQNSLKPLEIQNELLDRKVFLFTFREFQLIFGVSPLKAKYFLETYARKGLLVRLRRGIYALKNHFPSEEEIAGALYRPSYISFEYALAKHGIMPEMVYEVTSATTKLTRTFSIESKVFTYLKIKKEAYTGYALSGGTHKSYLAEPEKALVDYLYFVSLGRKPLNDRLNLDKLNMGKVIDYAELYDRPGLIKIIEKVCLPMK